MKHQWGLAVVAEKGDPQPGITLNLGITPTMTVAFAANPDFAQVEADQFVLIVNHRFPIFYDEKHPFFFEGIDAFQTPIDIIHTRTIVSPDFDSATIDGVDVQTSVAKPGFRRTGRAVFVKASYLLRTVL